MALVTPYYTYKLCSPVITLPNGLLYHLQPSKLLEVEVHAQLLPATRVLVLFEINLSQKKLRYIVAH